MSSKTNALRAHVESVLSNRVPRPFQYSDRQLVETVSSGIAEIDSLTGGLPRGSLTEIFGAPGCGQTTLLMASLASRTMASEVCALVDAHDSFDPHAAAASGVNLKRVLWVRCRNIDHALRATDLLIHGGGFGLIALDLSDISPRTVRQIPLNAWFRLRRAVENTPTILMAMEQEANAKTCASLVLRLESQEIRWSRTAAAVTDLIASDLTEDELTKDDLPKDDSIKDLTEDLNKNLTKNSNKNLNKDDSVAGGPIARDENIRPPSWAQLLDNRISHAEIIRSRVKVAELPWSRKRDTSVSTPTCHDGSSFQMEAIGDFRRKFLLF